MGTLGQKLGNLQGVMKGVGLGVLGLGTAAAGFGVASVKAFTDAGDEIQKMAQRTGFSTEALSELKYAGELSGTNLGGLSLAMGLFSFCRSSSPTSQLKNPSGHGDNLGLKWDCSSPEV